MWSIFFQSTSNYHARRFGVRAAMPGFIAKRLCPQLIIIPPNFDKYRAVSREVSLMSHPYSEPFFHWPPVTYKVKSKRLCTSEFGFSLFLYSHLLPLLQFINWILSCRWYPVLYFSTCFFICLENSLPRKCWNTLIIT